MRGGKEILASRHELVKFESFLTRCNLQMPYKSEIIPKAKVPLVKYVDKVTGLKVDVSFENDTGLIANRTFQEWKATFPVMPILVTLIKHLLAMRGLNEPVNGGIGGFSVTCLVVSLLQNMPQVQSGSMNPEHHLGEILMEFLDLYGNQFNYATTAIQLNPPGYIPKVS
jgi:non-canonical poly(A) RNA polymerase PAPD5/7